MVGHHHPLARAKAAGAVARLGDLAHDLVPEDGRQRRGPAKLGQVRAAQAAAEDPEQELAGADPGGGAESRARISPTTCVDGRPHGASWPCR